MHRPARRRPRRRARRARGCGRRSSAAPARSTTRHRVVLPASEAPATPTHLAVAQLEVDVEQRGRRRSGVAVADARQRRALMASHPVIARDRSSAASPATSAQRADRLQPASRRGAQSSVRRPGRAKPRASRAIVRSSTSAIEPRITGPTIGRMPAHAPPDGPLGVQPAGTLRGGDLARRARPWPAPSGPTRWPRTPIRGLDAAPLEVDDEVGRAGSSGRRG